MVDIKATVNNRADITDQVLAGHVLTAYDTVSELY